MVGTLVIAVGTFIVVLGLLVFLRSRDKRYEIKVTDIVVAVLPVVIYLLVSGKIQSLEFSEGGLKIETALNKASATEIKTQVTTIDGPLVQSVEVRTKGGVGDIPELIAKKTEALKFTLGYRGYDGGAIETYLQQLTQQGMLKYVVLENPDGTFFGTIDARLLNGMLTAQNPTISSGRFAYLLGNNDRKALSELPGFVSADHAMHVKDDKRRALQEMEAMNVDTLPVVDNENRYQGIVNRSRLTASLILDVAQAVAK